MKPTAREPAFLCIGHRGARGHAPENTLLALETGIRLGAHALEFDVQLHPSGELLLMHDLWLDRTTDARGLLAEQSLDALRALDAGQGERIPTLREALALIARRVRVNIELKTWDGTAAAVAACIREHLAAGWQPEDFLVSSFHWPELAAFHRELPQVPTGALICGVPADGAAGAAALGARALNISTEFVDTALLRDAHARGLKVYAYTVNLPAEIALMRRLGLDGVFTDYPERAL